MTVMSTQSLILLLTISLLFYLTADTVSVCRCVIFLYTHRFILTICNFMVFPSSSIVLIFWNKKQQ